MRWNGVREYCLDTKLYVGWIPGMEGAHSQGATPAELDANMREVLELLDKESLPIHWTEQGFCPPTDAFSPSSR